MTREQTLCCCLLAGHGIHKIANLLELPAGSTSKWGKAILQIAEADAFWAAIAGSESLLGLSKENWEYWRTSGLRGKARLHALRTHVVPMLR